MKDYRRKEPSFALCGLNCGLCPRHHTEGASRCPGCGGEDFAIKHPTCAVVTCNMKHDQVEYCFECSAFPCGRYATPSAVDSFISYANVLQNMSDAKKDLQGYLEELEEKQAILAHLLLNYNDGKSKGFYCLAVNLLPVMVLREIIEEIKSSTAFMTSDQKEKAQWVVALLNERADKRQIELKLRK